MKTSKNKEMIAIMAPVEITAGEAIEGAKPKPPRFEVIAYTGGALEVAGYEHPVVVDLDGMTFGKSLIANLDHVRTQRVGHVTERSTEGGQLRLGGFASAATEARREVVESASEDFVWQASIEAMPRKLVEVEAGETIEANGQKFKGPLFVAKESTLKGFAFVSHGADDDTTVDIAASAANHKGAKKMNAELKAWIEGMGFDVDELDSNQLAGLEANFNGTQGRQTKKTTIATAMDAKKLEAQRQEEILECAEKACDRVPFDQIDAIRDLANQAVEQNWTVKDFRLALYEQQVPGAETVTATRRGRVGQITEKMIEAAVCQAGGLPDLHKHYDEQTLDASYKRFRDGLGIQEILLIAAKQNGYDAVSIRSNLGNVLRAAFPDIRAAGFSTLSLPNILSNTANKFVEQGWMYVENAWRQIASTRSVRDFKQITSYALGGDMQYEQVGPAGEIKHGEVGETQYTNQANTYARMFAITRTDIINDDLGALTDIPMRLGRGAALKVNDVFWTAFLNNSTFFAAGNSNVSTGAGSALGTAAGAAINAAEVIFSAQTDPDGKPLGLMPSIILAPPTLKNTAAMWMGGQMRVADSTTANVYEGRYRVVSSDYMENSSYTGYSVAAWYLLADPRALSTIEVVFLNGRETPIVETAEADFNTLGIQSRGYHDFGVSTKEYRGGVRSAGS